MAHYRTFPPIVRQLTIISFRLRSQALAYISRHNLWGRAMWYLFDNRWYVRF